MMSFESQLTRISHLISSCLDFVEELLDESNSFAVSELPDCAIFEILLKLPVKSVGRCKCVCKSWNHLISDPYFSSVYFNNSPFPAFAITLQELDDTKHLEPDTQYFNYVEIGRDGDVKDSPLSLNFPVTEARKNWISIIDSCDGLLCLVETPYKESPHHLAQRSLHMLINPNQAIWIVNPLIQEYMALPKVHGFENNVRVVYGFGSTVDGKHYKIVRVAMKACRRVVEAHILTIGVDVNWRELNIPLYLWSHGVTLNGFLHFLGSNDCNRGSPAVIYAFDIRKEMGHCFAIPCVAYWQWSCKVFLAIWDGHLCITDCSRAIEVDIWTTKQYGVVESWRRDIILRSELMSCVWELVPIATMRNGELMFSHGGILFSFDQKTNNCVLLEGFARNGLDWFLAGCAYAPSFFSPRGIC